MLCIDSNDSRGIEIPDCIYKVHSIKYTLSNYKHSKRYNKLQNKSRIVAVCYAYLLERIFFTPTSINGKEILDYTFVNGNLIYVWFFSKLEHDFVNTTPFRMWLSNI